MWSPFQALWVLLQRSLQVVWSPFRALWAPLQGSPTVAHAIVMIFIAFLVYSFLMQIWIDTSSAVKSGFGAATFAANQIAFTISETLRGQVDMFKSRYVIQDGGGSFVVKVWQGVDLENLLDAVDNAPADHYAALPKSKLIQIGKEIANSKGVSTTEKWDDWKLVQDDGAGKVWVSTGRVGIRRKTNRTWRRNPEYDVFLGYKEAGINKVQRKGGFCSIMDCAIEMNGEFMEQVYQAFDLLILDKAKDTYPEVIDLKTQPAIAT
jgi:hypothetical protein